MTEAEAKITSKGQITLPSLVLQRLNVGPGDSVVFEDNNGEIVVRSKSGTLSDMRGMLRRKAKSPTRSTIERWVGEARSTAWRPATSKRKRKAR